MNSRFPAGRCRPLVAVALLALPLPSSAANPVINEILYRPGTGFPEASQLEFVELHNPAGEPADLSGWAFTQGVRYTFPAGAVLAGGGYLVVAADPAALLAARPGLAAEAVLGPWEAGLKLSNRGETLTLAAPDPSAGDGWRTVDRVSYAHEGDWATRTRDSLGGWSWITQANGGGCSTERRNPLLVVDSGQNWADSAAVGGTPGLVNSRFVANVAPVIQKVRHHPAVPTSAEPVTVSCELADEADLSTLGARLWWRNATTTTPGAFQSLGMTHEGNGRFSATLAPMANKGIIEFYIAATDGTLTRTWPAPNSEGQTTNCAYQVDNEVITGTAPAYRLVLTAAENAAFTAVNA
ncbi:MAG: lamin tail domain-containing protein, partial [Akkermansiaceae bacterium]|nr:lamin tail domain-containing protein [Akkermansiaceae bacterium]